MLTSDNNMSNYDISILKNNIKKRMKEMGITQTALSSETGIQQPTISNVLSGKDSSCFSVVQLVSISHVLETTPDELLGIKQKKSHDIKNLGDIADFFFKMSHLINCRFETLTLEASHDDEGVYDNGVGYDNHFVKDYHAIYFENKYLDAFIKNWGKISNSILDDECKKEVMDAWESSKIIQLKKYEAQNSFLTPLERGKQLCVLIDKLWTSYCEGERFGLIKHSDLVLALSYIYSSKAKKDYNSIDYELLFDHVNCYNRKFDEIDNARNQNTDDDLPFN